MVCNLTSRSLHVEVVRVMVTPSLRSVLTRQLVSPVVLAMFLRKFGVMAAVAFVFVGITEFIYSLHALV